MGRARGRETHTSTAAEKNISPHTSAHDKTKSARVIKGGHRWPSGGENFQEKNGSQTAGGGKFPTTDWTGRQVGKSESSDRAVGGKKKGGGEKEKSSPQAVDSYLSLPIRLAKVDGRGEKELEGGKEELTRGGEKKWIENRDRPAWTDTRQFDTPKEEKTKQAEAS